MAASQPRHDRRRASTSGHGPPPEYVAGGAQWSPVATAALVGGAIAATAGAWLGTRAIARRNARADGKPINSVMANAITASDVAHSQTEGPTEREPRVVPEPRVPAEPRV